MLQTLDGYTLMRRICQTASSEIFLAHDHRRREDVVLKVVLPQLAADKKTLSHFAHEAEVSARLEHPNLVKVYDFVRRAERPYLVMKLVPGRTLKRVIYRDSDVADRLGFAWIVRTCQALGHMHRSGWVHLDIKPENILVTDTGDAGVIDLALAQRIAPKGFWGSLVTKLQGQAMGTRSYIAPEQIENRAVGPGTDIYSLGITMFEMYARRLPLTASDPEAILQMHLKTRPPMLHHVVPEVHPDLSRLVGRML
ncbi:MAG: serine/threonine protein kinase, partial [Planctomycetes bacterium]|nr:serine/threonine protein kinase [Planctomycetota bacterium]